MYQNSIVKKYANALLSSAIELKSEDKVSSDLNILEELFKELDIVLMALGSKIIKQSEKNNFIMYISKEFSINLIVENVLYVLVKNDRIKYFMDIIKSYRSLLLKQKGIKEIDLFSAEKIEKAGIFKIKSYFEKQFNTEVLIREFDDESLIGGVVAKYGSIEFDCSIKGALNKITHKISDRKNMEFAKQ